MNARARRVEVRTRLRREDHLERQADTLLSQVFELRAERDALRETVEEMKSRNSHLARELRIATVEKWRAEGRVVTDEELAEAFR